MGWRELKVICRICKKESSVISDNGSYIGKYCCEKLMEIEEK